MDIIKTHFRFDVIHIFKLLSSEAVNKLLPSGENWTERTIAKWVLNSIDFPLI